MKKIILFTLLPVIALIFFTGCVEEGCTDPNALNTDFTADEDDGSCIYSRVGFYASAGFFNGIAISRVDVSINGNNIGTTSGIFYPGGPGNCSAPGTVPYQFENGRSVDWNATVFLVSGATIFTSGQVSPSSVSECIRVNMTQ